MKVLKIGALIRVTVRKVWIAAARPARSPYVFPVEPPDKLFPEVCKPAEVHDFTWHCLRHTFASRLVTRGVDLRTVQDLMGHKSIITTMHYAHPSEHQADAVERLVRASSAGSTDTTISTKRSALPTTAIVVAA